jgi:hypothetical protein
MQGQMRKKGRKHASLIATGDTFETMIKYNIYLFISHRIYEMKAQ